MRLLRDFEKGIKESAKLCLSYLKMYKKQKGRSSALADHCLDKALDCLNTIEVWFKKATVYRDRVSELEFAKLVRVKKESKQKCILKFAELGIDISNL